MPGIVVVILMIAAFGAGLVVSRRAAARTRPRTRSPPPPTAREVGDEIETVIVRASRPSNRFANTEPLWKVPAPSAPNPFDPEPSVELITPYGVRPRPRAETPRRFTRGSVVPYPTTTPLDHAPQTLDDLLTPPDGIEREEPTVIVDDALLRDYRD